MPSEVREITFAQAILEATDQCMAKDPTVFVLGLGVDDPKAIFNTTKGLKEKYGSQRCFDVPVSENALTGAAIGAATLGMRPLLTHQRIDFALLSLDQIINSAAKWHYMFAGQLQCPIVIRMLIGRGWGQGPQHSQSLQAIFAHIPGLKVVMPATPHDAKGILVSSIEDNGPVIYLEHRWLHNMKGPVPDEIFREPIGRARIVKPGKDATIVAISYMVFEAFRAAECLMKNGVDVEVIDLRTVKPYDQDSVLASVKKTGRLLVADTGHGAFGIGAEIVASTTERLFASLKSPPVRVSSPDYPVPTSHALAAHYYPRAHDLASQTLKMIGFDDFSKRDRIIEELKELQSHIPSDVPDLRFTGPF
ncbi:MAG: alpha-ketoacid dehydrogenase subunit beta [Deltaproteobacteria bacterium]|nr:alpha-ketoacid dehydrogenase subunit beta [Deltaproteobacteria bacterium]